MPGQESPEDIKSNTSRAGMSQTGDSSIRCRVSEICDGQREQCYPGADGLGCINDIGQRRDYVIDAIKWAWTSYQRCAWGYDELQPISCRGRQWFGLGLYMVDALDTLILAGMTEVTLLPIWLLSYLTLPLFTKKFMAGCTLCFRLATRN